MVSCDLVVRDGDVVLPSSWAHQVRHRHQGRPLRSDPRSGRCVFRKEEVSARGSCGVSRRRRRSSAPRSWTRHRAAARAARCRPGNRSGCPWRRHVVHSLRHGDRAVRQDVPGDPGGQPRRRAYRLCLSLRDFDRRAACGSAEIRERSRRFHVQDFHEYPGRRGQAARPAGYRRWISAAPVRSRGGQAAGRSVRTRRRSKCLGRCAIG